jgi:hypothetical protein
VSFTALAWWPFLVLALVRRRARDWAVFAAYLTAVAAEIVALSVLAAQGLRERGHHLLRGGLARSGRRFESCSERRSAHFLAAVFARRKPAREPISRRSDDFANI